MVTFFPLFMFWRQFKKFTIFIKMVRILRKMSHTKFPAYQYQKNIWQKHECPLPIQYPLYCTYEKSHHLFTLFLKQWRTRRTPIMSRGRTVNHPAGRTRKRKRTSATRPRWKVKDQTVGAGSVVSAAFPPIPAPFPPTILTFPMSWISPGPSLFIFNKILSR